MTVKNVCYTITNACDGLAFVGVKLLISLGKREALVRRLLAEVGDRRMAIRAERWMRRDNGGWRKDHRVARAPKTFLVQVTYVMRTEHRVRASSYQEAEGIAIEQPIQSEPVLVDILDSAVLQEL